MGLGLENLTNIALLIRVLCLRNNLKVYQSPFCFGTVT